MRDELASVTVHPARDIPKTIGHALFWVGAVTLSGLLWMAAIRVVARLAE